MSESEAAEDERQTHVSIKDNGITFWSFSAPQGELSIRCHRCSEFAEKLCDYPVGKDDNGKVETCDMPLCDTHAHTLSDKRDVHFCPTHAAMWEAQSANPVQLIIHQGERKGVDR